MKILFKNESKMKIFPDKQKLREFIIGRPVCQEIFKFFKQKKYQVKIKKQSTSEKVWVNMTFFLILIFLKCVRTAA